MTCGMTRRRSMCVLLIHYCKKYDVTMTLSFPTEIAFLSSVINFYYLVHSTLIHQGNKYDCTLVKCVFFICFSGQSWCLYYHVGFLFYQTECTFSPCGMRANHNDLHIWYYCIYITDTELNIYRTSAAFSYLIFTI